MQKKFINIRGKLISLTKPRVMGILNITPDSFFSGSRTSNNSAVIDRAGRMIEEGATFLDIGGYSTRPGADDISPEEEEDRVLSALEALRKNYPEAYVSIDTFRRKVAESALDAGADLINDVSGGDLDPTMFDLIASRKVPYIVMHMRGTPQTMKNLSNYEDLVSEVIDHLHNRIQKLRKSGVCDIIADPGFGFAKSIPQNYELLKKLNYFEVLETPLLIGLSRKSMFYKFFKTTPDQALNATTAAHMISLINGASILRVHDVREASEAIKIYELTR